MMESKVMSPELRRGISRDEVEAFCEELAKNGAIYEQIVRSREPDTDAERWKAALMHVRTLNRQLQTAEDELLAQVEELTLTIRSLDLERQRYRDLFERTPDAHFIADRMGVIHEANAAGLTLLQRDFPAVRGKPLAQYIERDSLHAFRAATNDLPKGSPVEVIVKFLQHEGSPRATRLRGCLTSNPHQTLWVARDAWSNAKSAPADSNRGRRDSIEPSAEAQPMSFGRAAIAAFSSELRAPLQTVLEWTHTLRNGGLGASDRERALERIEQSVMTQAGIVEGLFDVSRITTGRLELSRGRVDLGKLVAQAVEALMPVANSADVILRVHAEDVVVVDGDETRLLQVVLNLLSNALKFTPAGGAVNVRIRRKESVGALSIADTGRGIRPEVLPRIFECFRNDSGLGDAQTGMGLGLFLVKRLTELHGGTVEATSEGEGQGTTFVLSLPALDAPTGS